MKKKIILGLGVILLLLVTFLAGCVKPTEYMVSMRDGVKLATDVYVPNKYTQPHGAILIRTPYNKDGLILLGMNWAKNGWPTVGQDMRGRYASEGIDTVFKNEHTDGPDTLAWIANQTWSNGKIAWENMMTILDTCRKQDVNFMDYVEDIFSGRYAMPRLSTLISEKATVNPTSY